VKSGSGNLVTACHDLLSLFCQTPLPTNHPTSH
jgi:hypothetical protein